MQPIHYFTEIKSLVQVTAEEILSLGDFGYISNQKYEVKKEESLQSCAIMLQLVDLDEPYVKQDLIEADDLNRYQDLIKQGYSLGLYVDHKLIALAIAEAQTWNNTLLLWYLHVHEDHRRQRYGHALLSKMIELAQGSGFRALTLEAQNTNVPAIHFYKSLGFEIEGIDLSLYNLGEDNEEVALFLRKKF
ncbi:GNAT family N-acetyltransferase [Paenibacillus guangzhouensis]|uniref:GNAT family N-acetyltransferase n=1 Tax=Paenibacillus guangzhouensis TaxID=1473112 RepID=UPI0012669618|nr:GNAT family N-acetyltransferase [Paenibacillus guangzhouensis]